LLPLNRSRDGRGAVPWHGCVHKAKRKANNLRKERFFREEEQELLDFYRYLGNHDRMCVWMRA